MTPAPRTPVIYIILILFIATAVLVTPMVRASDQPIDLDDNAANGDESRVSTKVLQSFPVMVENTVLNNASGEAFDFSWPGAGPGGFASFVTAGPGVGTKWVWSSVYQVYTIESPVTFTPSRSLSVFGAPPQGVEPVGGTGTGTFTTLGKSIYPNQITLSDASLSASLITFFSPPKIVASCGFECTPSTCDIFLANDSGGTATVKAEQLDCCPEPHQIVCGGDCTSYLTDPLNCGGCGNTCAADEICSDGMCSCPPGQDQCGTGCVDLQTDPSNCGGCGTTCMMDEVCSGGACVCAPGLTACGPDMCIDLNADPLNCGSCGRQCEPNDTCQGGFCVPCPPSAPTQCDNACVDTLNDPLNCGGCGNVCDFSACPVPGQGTCNQGASCVCDPAPGSNRGGASRQFSPVQIVSSGSTQSSLSRRSAGSAQTTLQARRGVAKHMSPPLETTSTPTLAAATGAPAVTEAPVCDLPPIEQVIPSGGMYTQTQTGGRFGKEIQTTVTLEAGGKMIASGPCPLVVPVTGVDTSGIILSPTAVATRDESGDGLCQPGEAWCEYHISLADLGDTPCTDPFATLSSPPDQFNANSIVFLNATSAYPSLPAYPGDGVPLEKRANDTAFSITTQMDQAPDVGRPFTLSLTCTNHPTPVETPIVLGIGSVCDPAVRTPGDYDRVDGFQAPFKARLVPRGNPVNYSTGKYNLGSTIPMKVSLGCGSQTLSASEIAPFPEIVGLDHETLGPQPLTGINGDNNANPDDPQFSCGTSGCDYQFRTNPLPAGRYIVSVQMPDSRVFQAGFTISP